MRFPPQFHLPESANLPTYQIAYISNWAECCNKSMAASITSNNSDRYHDFDSSENQMPPIKCSLCKCSTPRKSNPNPINVKKPFDDDDDVYETASMNNSDVSMISSISSSTAPAHDDHCANRLIVRIFASSKWTRLVDSLTFSNEFVFVLLQFASIMLIFCSLLWFLLNF